MKLLLDCIYTGPPSTCSTSYLCWEIIEQLSAEQEDLFFYLTYPESVQGDAKEMAFLSRHSDRVTLIPLELGYRDRVRELYSFPRDLQNLLAPGVQVGWDADVVLTSRITQMPMMRVSFSRMQSTPKRTLRGLIGLDEMPVFSFRDTVPWSCSMMDLTSLNAYLFADGVIVNNLWTKSRVLKLARHQLSAARIKELYPLIREAVPVPLAPLEVRDKTWSTGDDFFYVVFTGRMTATRNFEEVLKLFSEHFAYDIGGRKQHVKYVVSTNSCGLGGVKKITMSDLDFMEVQMNDREKFHDLLKTKAHVVVNLSPVEDFSLSTYEPLKFGVPVIVPEKPWSEFLGHDYPFRVDGHVQAYATVKEFIFDYWKQYERFRTWEGTTWNKVVNGPQNVTTAQSVRGLLSQWEDTTLGYLEDRQLGGKYIAIADSIVADGLSEVDLIAYLLHKKAIPTPKDWTQVPIALRPSLLVLKLLLRMRGYRDTNQCGVMTHD